MDPMDDDAGIGPAIGRFEMHLITPPMLFGCERMPFLVVLGAVSFIILAVFGITPWGILGGALMLIGAVIWLRRIGEYDPQWFAMRLERMKYPLQMPDVLPDPRLKDWDFVGFDDPPAPEVVMKAWLGVCAAALVPAGLVVLLIGMPAGVVSFVSLMSGVVIWVFRDKLVARMRLRR